VTAVKGEFLIGVHVSYVPVYRNTMGNMK